MLKEAGVFRAREGATAPATGLTGKYAAGHPKTFFSRDKGGNSAADSEPCIDFIV